MSESTAVAIIRKTFTVSITYVNKPSELERRVLKDARYRFENRQWYKSQSEGQHADAKVVADLIAAS